MLIQPPTVTDTRVFATLPDKYRTRKEPNPWLDAHGATRTTVLEGPSFDRDGFLYCVDIPNGRVFKVDPGGSFQLIADYDGWPNGLKIHKDGRIFIADFKHGIMLLDPASGHVEPYLTRAGLEPFKGVNDLFFASNGDLYFTDQGMTGLHDPTGRVYKLSASGGLRCLLNNVPSPNGIVMNPDETILYVSATRGNAVWRVPLSPSGDISKVGIYIQLSGSRGGPDGLAMDERGGLLVAPTGSGHVWLFDEIGEPVTRIRSCRGLHNTNIAFGGADRRDLYITESETGSILVARLETPGSKMYSGT